MKAHSLVRRILLGAHEKIFLAGPLFSATSPEKHMGTILVGRARLRRRTLSFVILLAATTFANAATNELTGVLQKGLFEEEANHNLGAAILAYQAVVNQFDNDRKLAATAVFRLGECYRKQGATNE